MTAPTLKPAEITRRRTIIRSGLTKFLKQPKGYALREIFDDKQHPNTPPYAQRAVKRLIARRILAFRKTRYWLVAPDEALELSRILSVDEDLDDLFLEREQQLGVTLTPPAEEDEDEEPVDELRILIDGEPLEEGAPGTADEDRALTAAIGGKIETFEQAIVALTKKVDQLSAEQEATSKLYLESASALQEISVLFRMFAEQQDFFTQIKEAHEVLMFMKNKMLNLPAPTKAPAKVTVLDNRG